MEGGLRLRHRGRLTLTPGMVWRDDDGWRFACPHGCAAARREVYASPKEAAHALAAHWERERERELARLARAQDDAARPLSPGDMTRTAPPTL